jgi:hypothetical protein
MLQKPNIAKILYPDLRWSKSPTYWMFSAIIFDPASPNPRANNFPIFKIACSIIVVSIS